MATQHRSHPRNRIVFAVMILATLLSACSSPAVTPAPSAAPSTAPSAAVTEAPSVAPASGGILTAAWIGPCCLDVDTNNPLSAGGDAHW